MEPGEEPHRATVRDALGFLYPHLSADASFDGYPPFEEFLSLVTVSRDFQDRDEGDGFYEKGDWDKVRVSALDLLTRCLIRKMREAREHDEAVKKFIHAVGPNDVIVTFNWDTLIEQHLYEAKKPFIFGLSDTSIISVLKLHGSLSWIQLPATPETEPEPAQPQRLVELDRDSRLYFLNHEYLSQLDKISSKHRPYIIPPVWHKTPILPFIQQLWYQAHLSIGEAMCEEHSKVIVIGYSLPPEDLHARALLRAVLGVNAEEGGKMYLIDPDSSVAGRFYATVTKHLEYYQTHFTGHELERIISA